MLPELDNYDWEEIFHYVGKDKTEIIYNTPRFPPELYKDKITREDVKEIIHIFNGEGDGPNWWGIFKIKCVRWGQDWEQFLYVDAGCDYSGWG